MSYIIQLPICPKAFEIRKKKRELERAFNTEKLNRLWSPLAQANFVMTQDDLSSVISQLGKL